MTLHKSPKPANCWPCSQSHCCPTAQILPKADEPLSHTPDSHTNPTTNKGTGTTKPETPLHQAWVRSTDPAQGHSHHHCQTLLKLGTVPHCCSWPDKHFFLSLSLCTLQDSNMCLVSLLFSRCLDYSTTQNREEEGTRQMQVDWTTTEYHWLQSERPSCQPRGQKQTQVI